ncbi:MAG: hypothetical protein PHS61_07600 [Candidatus Omnitrophica bacterium]|nr:hypothetical protein [Candidatus Omnitrophota bacterium]
MALRKLKIAPGTLAIWKSVISVTTRKPAIFLPFCFIAALEVVVLFLLCQSPHAPLNIIMGPPIRRIWGQVYMHYPFFYELLPRLFYYAKIFLGIFFGSVTTGMAICAVSLARKGEPVDLKDIFRQVLRRYLTLIVLTSILYVAVHILMKQPSQLLFKYFRGGHAKLLFLGPKFWVTFFIPVLNFLLAVVLQGLFVYTIPYVVLKGKKFIPALLLGMRLFLKLIPKTVFVVAIPMILYIPVTMLRNNIGLLADKSSPEIVGLILFIGILIGTLIVDALITVATTLIFIEETHEA